MDFEGFQRQLRQFVDERDWGKFHSPRNLMLALTGEVGELAAEMQWMADSDLARGVRSPETEARLSQELADVAIYLLRLADVLEVDLAEAIAAKLELNGRRYPADVVRGSAIKYSELGRLG